MPAPTLEHSRAALALHRSPLPALRRLAVEEAENSIVITGTVASYYLKQLAQEAVMPTLAGRKLLNRVTVVAHLSDELPTAELPISLSRGRATPFALPPNCSARFVEHFRLKPQAPQT